MKIKNPATPDERAIAAAQGAAEKVRANRVLRFNNQLDAVVAGAFLSLVAVILVLCVREWIMLLSRAKPAVLREAEPVWLPKNAVLEGGPRVPWWNVFALLFGLARELSNEAAMDRDEKAALACTCDSDRALTPEQRYVKVTEERFNGIRRCC